jgi:hypothetical protein
MRVVEISRSDHTDLEVKNHDVKIMLGCVVFAVALLIGIYAASMSPAFTPDEFASVSFFP